MRNACHHRTGSRVPNHRDEIAQLVKNLSILLKVEKGSHTGSRLTSGCGVDVAKNADNRIQASPRPCTGSFGAVAMPQMHLLTQNRNDPFTERNLIQLQHPIPLALASSQD